MTLEQERAGSYDLRSDRTDLEWGLVKKIEMIEDQHPEWVPYLEPIRKSPRLFMSSSALLAAMALMMGYIASKTIDVNEQVSGTSSALESTASGSYEMTGSDRETSQVLEEIARVLDDIFGIDEEGKLAFVQNHLSDVMRMNVMGKGNVRAQIEALLKADAEK